MGSKTKIGYHIIFVTKYRRKILSGTIKDFILDEMARRLKQFKLNVIAMEIDLADHIHILIEAKPTQSVSMIVRALKQYTSYHAWQQYGPLLRKHYWYHNHFWSRGYFCSTIGDASEETIRRYIENQGQ